MMSDSEDSSSDPNEYSIEDYYKLVRPLWAARNINANYLNNHKLLRTLVDFSLSHSLPLKNLQKRELELGDIIPTKINYVDTLIIKSKNTTDNEGLFQYSGCFRHQFVEFCPHLAISAYLFSRFHIPDEYGSFEFILSDATKRISLEEVKLLKGNNKLSAISYSQQHKSSINALSISGLNYKDINLTKLLSTQDFEYTEKAVSRTLDGLPHQIMLQLAGFDSFQNYNIPRNAIEPHQELLDSIFPFVNQITPEFYNEDMLRIKELLIMLRRSLCQDMVVIKQKYPLNPLSKSDIFNSREFEKFSKQVEDAGELDGWVHDSCFSPNDTNEDLPHDNWPVFQDPDSKAELQRVIEFQMSKLRSLDNQVSLYAQEQSHMYSVLSKFIETQNEVFQRQSEYMQRVQNSINGLVILMSSKNKNTIPLAQQSLNETRNFINTVESTNLKQGLDTTIELLAKLNSSQMQQYQLQQQQAHQLQQTQPHSSVIPITNNHPVFNIHAATSPSSKSLSPDPQSQTPMSPVQLERQRVLNRRLSRQATTLFEMWDDFKGLEKELKDHEITVTEWLKVHGSSERQFRHTRLKIIKFIEDEAQRRGTTVEYVKERLHNKMRNRLRPWTLDEVQRMLTSGKRINLDDNR
ncbi:uncharacterized protein SPAPADRAFT_68392 [Spathaspora passalidarum NRRL Y-27907]|uniref:Ndc10 domain-containing protein n=1 Tax=Spathaspora passalidarum (strain NRRL Y-27907 / 11-Y1) TaxID=619300 RepID=G3ATP4_SPAPN|nr:uncharacterized protein SPAPADRAFT_68392 [Spathaspora passalidarum NRRL Y-27907]EGW30270.1 hypothetical protein SPAPADRAFT_68392 [Spathaspora passalidarum NRRL Y-27907]